MLIFQFWSVSLQRWFFYLSGGYFYLSGGRGQPLPTSVCTPLAQTLTHAHGHIHVQTHAHACTHTYTHTNTNTHKHTHLQHLIVVAILNVAQPLGKHCSNYQCDCLGTASHNQSDQDCRRKDNLTLPTLWYICIYKCMCKSSKVLYKWYTCISTTYVQIFQDNTDMSEYVCLDNVSRCTLFLKCCSNDSNVCTWLK